MIGLIRFQAQPSSGWAFLHSASCGIGRCGGRFSKEKIMPDLTKVEYRVREIKRYAVTRYHQAGDSAGVESGVETKGEYASATTAYDVAYALAKHEHYQLGWPIDDERIQYPAPPDAALESVPSA
jgi:hypothetical protein